jgi:hypothetical protein
MARSLRARVHDVAQPLTCVPAGAALIQSGRV